MSQPVWQATVSQVGRDAAEMFEAGVYILFGEPVPDALAEVSLVHSGHAGEFCPIEPGDEMHLGDASVLITEVGSLANPNFQELGHIVLYLNVGDADLLPGAVKAEGTLPTPNVGDQVRFLRPAKVDA